MNDNPNIFGDFINGGDDMKIDGRYRQSWVEDSFFFEKQTGRQIASHQSRSYIGSQFSKIHARNFLIGIFICISILIGRVAYLQIIKGNDYRLAAEGLSQRIIPIPSERGLIFDRKGTQLTKNIPNFSIALVRQDLPRKLPGETTNSRLEKMIFDLAEITERHPDYIRKTIEEYGTYGFESIVIEEDIDYETALSIQIASADLPGIVIQRGSKRLYIGEDESASSTLTSLAHIIGYQGKLSPEELPEKRTQGYISSDVIGKTGTERTYETALRGTYGKRLIEVNALGKQQRVLNEESPTPGKNIRLTVDHNVQKALEEIMQKNMAFQDKHRGSAIVMDPNSGEIIALVSLPGFNNNDFSGGIDYDTYQGYLTNKHQPLFNRAIGGMYPSGSTLKPAVASAALQEGLITANTTFPSFGGLQIGPWFFPDWQSGGHGPTNVRKSLAQSVNTFYYYIGGGYEEFTGLGVARTTEYLRQFGFANALGIDLPGEKPGFLPSKEWKESVKKERWYVGDTYNLSIGQGDVLVTPLQIASMTATIANGGTVYQPHIVRDIIDPLTSNEKRATTTIQNKAFINPSYLSTIRWGMRDCVIYGSCRRLATAPLNIAGKTGTAQWNRNKENHAWFTSFAPFKNPQVVVTVLIEEGGEGSKIAVPIADEFYRWWWQYKNSADS